MKHRPAINVSNTQFNMERNRLIEELVLRMDDITSIAIITIDTEGNDQIEVLGDLCMLQQLAALTTQQIGSEISSVESAH